MLPNVDATVSREPVERVLGETRALVRFGPGEPDGSHA